MIDSPVWPRGDFAFNADGRLLAAPLQRDPAVVGVWDVALGRLTATIRGSSATGHRRRLQPGRSATGHRGDRQAEADVGGDDLGPGFGPARPDFRCRPESESSLSHLPATAARSRRVAAGSRGKPRVGPPSGTRRTAPSSAPGTGWAWSSTSHSTRTGSCSRSRILGTQSVHLWDLAAGTLITQPGAARGQLRGFHPGRHAAGISWARRQRPPCRRPDRRAGAGAPELRPTPWHRRLDASAGLQRRRLAHRRPPSPAFSTSGKPGLRSIRRSSPKPDDVAGWLRRSRSFATRRGRHAGPGRLRTSPRDSDRPAGAVDPAWPGRRHRARAGRDGLRQGLYSRCDDPIRWLALRARARALRPETRGSDRIEESPAIRGKTTVRRARRRAGGLGPGRPLEGRDDRASRTGAGPSLCPRR